jgi:hypothetical protein
VAQDVGPEFKSDYWKKKKRLEILLPPPKIQVLFHKFAFI